MTEEQKTQLHTMHAAAPALLEAVEMLMRLVKDMMPGVRYIALPDYQLLNEALIKGEQAIRDARGKA